MKFLVCKATFMRLLITTKGLKSNPTIVNPILNMHSQWTNQTSTDFLSIPFLTCNPKGQTRHPQISWSNYLLRRILEAPVVLQVDSSDYGMESVPLQPTEILPDNTIMSVPCRLWLTAPQTSPSLRNDPHKLKRNVLLTWNSWTSLTIGCSANQVSQFTQTLNHFSPSSKRI